MTSPVPFAIASSLLLAALGTVAAHTPDPITVRVIDAATNAPIAGAIVSTAREERRTNADGVAQLEHASGGAAARAYGYNRLTIDTARGGSVNVMLQPLAVKALYLTVYGIGSRALREGVLTLAERTEINAVVIDLKGDRGLIPYPTGNRLAAAAGALKVTTIRDPAALINDLHARGLYAVARIVVFKDDPFATAHPDLAVHRRDGSLFRDGEGLAWTDPHNREVWDYNIDIAVEAARAGFDEIQFDYVRLPDAAGLVLSRPDKQAHREDAIAGFLAAAREALRPFNVFVAADVFGYVCWNANDTGIGQRLERLLDHADYLSPMLYPSSFQFGIPGYRNPVEHPYEIVRLSIDKALQRTQASPLRFRPWLQAFRDYAFRGGAFDAGEIRKQIDAAEDAGASGWMLWNPHNRYSAKDLDAKVTESAPGRP